MASNSASWDFQSGLITLTGQTVLFSAGHARFLLVSLAILRPDNSQLSAQLRSLPVLRNGAPSNIQPFLNATPKFLAVPTTFYAPTSVIIFDTLWFTSLALRLATALCGILAKQLFRGCRR